MHRRIGLSTAFPLLLIAIALLATAPIVATASSPYEQEEKTTSQEHTTTPTDSIQQLDEAKSDSLKQVLVASFAVKEAKMDSLRQADSIQRVELLKQLEQVKQTNSLEKQRILDSLEAMHQREQARILARRQHLDSIRQLNTGAPVVGILGDTITTIYLRMGSIDASERASRISKRVKRMYDKDFSEKDTLTLDISENYVDINYYDQILMSITENDALLYGLSMQEYAEQLCERFTTSLLNAREENSLQNLIIRIGLVLFSIVGVFIALRLLNLLFRRLRRQVSLRRDKLFKDLKYRDYTFITITQMETLSIKLVSVLHWAIIVMILVFVIPIVFSIFPFTRNWSSQLFDFLLTPIKRMFQGAWNYLPNLVNILVVVVALRYLVKILRYFFDEIEQGKLKFPGFEPEFAPPTFAIVRTLLFFFGVILVFPYLPGAGSEAFNAISILVGALFTLGSSGAISNMIAGIIITYMRPFKVGDRIKVDGITGDVIEKSLLVTKVKQVTNEEVTIPNSKILNSNTINYSALVETKGLILSTEVTIGYEVPWREVEDMLIEAILRCPRILPAPKPFVLQMALNDNYVVYTINGYTTDANAQAGIYSEIRGHIQDVCSERNIELLSPHYRAVRDGNEKTIPPIQKDKKTTKEEKPLPRAFLNNPS